VCVRHAEYCPCKNHYKTSLVLLEAEPGKNRQGSEANRAPPSGVEVNNGRTLTPLSHYRVDRDKLTLLCLTVVIFRIHVLFSIQGEDSL
jgi:hypothetical protein